MQFDPTIRLRREAGSRIVVITDRSDAHLPYVQRHLTRELTVLDPLCGKLSVQRGPGRCALLCDGEEVSGVGGVWFRKPLLLLDAWLAAHVDEPHRKYAREALTLFTGVLRAEWPDATWVSDRHNIARADNKALQLELASLYGLRVPETIFTSDPAAAAAFLDGRAATITKPIGPPTTPGGSRQRFLATRVHGLEGLKGGLEGLPFAPAIFQQAITAVADLRVTVVGASAYPARMDVDEALVGVAGTRDWRDTDQCEEPPRWRETRLPADVEHGCIALTRALGLWFAAIDLVVDAEGDIWFIELNPNGQWGFVERDTGLPIGRALAELLELALRR